MLLLFNFICAESLLEHNWTAHQRLSWHFSVFQHQENPSVRWLENTKQNIFLIKYDPRDFPVISQKNHSKPVKYLKPRLLAWNYASSDLSKTLCCRRYLYKNSEDLNDHGVTKRKFVALGGRWIMIMIQSHVMNRHRFTL